MLKIENQSASCSLVSNLNPVNRGETTTTHNSPYLTQGFLGLAVEQICASGLGSLNPSHDASSYTLHPAVPTLGLHSPLADTGRTGARAAQGLDRALDPWET